MPKKSLIALLVVFALQISSAAFAQNHSKALQNLGADDVMFAQMMIPHHQQAVEMAEIALKKAPGSALTRLSREIISAQKREMNEMKFWLKVSKASEEMHHSMPMKGMLSEQDFKKLRSLTGTKFQKLYTTLMIEHHEGAIEMVSLLKKSKNKEAQKLGQTILRDQKAEINVMKNLLKAY